MIAHVIALLFIRSTILLLDRCVLFPVCWLKIFAWLPTILVARWSDRTAVCLSVCPDANF